jgi:iron complex outermembrane receptor protein
MMGMMAGNASALAAAFNAANRDLSFNSMDAVFKVLHRTDAGTELRFEVAHKTRAPSYQELYLWLPLQATGGLADGRSYVGNLGLDEERSSELTVGLGKQLPGVTVSPQLFYKKVAGYIQGVPTDNVFANAITMMNAGQPALEFSNVDAEFWGADIAWKIDIAERVFVDGALSYVRGRRTDLADNLYRLAPPNASIGVTWQPEDWSLTAELVAYAKQDKVAVFNGEAPTAGYALSNLAISWEPGERLRAEARVDNLFDRTYQDHVAGTNRAAGSDLPRGVRLYGTERTLSMGVMLSF